MKKESSNARRQFLTTAFGASAGIWGNSVLAQAVPFVMNPRYPDPAVLILDPSFAKYRLYSSSLEQVATGFRWTEGPAYFPDGAYLLFSDIPNNRIMKFDEKTGKTSVFRANANYANGNARDRQGRLARMEAKPSPCRSQGGRTRLLRSPHRHDHGLVGVLRLARCDDDRVRLFGPLCQQRRF